MVASQMVDILHVLDIFENKHKSHVYYAADFRHTSINYWNKSIIVVAVGGGGGGGGGGGQQNTSRPRQNGHHFPDDILNASFLNENCCILMNILLKFVPQDTIKIFHIWFR